MTIERFQAIACPDAATHFHLEHEAMLYEGDSFYCRGCGKHHVATPQLVRQYERLPDASLRAVPLRRHL